MNPLDQKPWPNYKPVAKPSGPQGILGFFYGVGVLCGAAAIFMLVIWAIEAAGRG